MNRQERDERWKDGKNYERCIHGELTSFRKEAWKRQLGRQFASGKALDILDVGTGPEFFAYTPYELRN